MLAQLDRFRNSENIICGRNDPLEDLAVRFFDAKEPPSKISANGIEAWAILFIRKRRSSEERRARIEEAPLIDKFQYTAARKRFISRCGGESAASWLLEREFHLFLLGARPPPADPLFRVK